MPCGHARRLAGGYRRAMRSRRIVATVADDGIGLPADWSRPGHLVLRGLSTRAAIGGTFTVGNQAGRGVCLSADIPLGDQA